MVRYHVAKDPIDLFIAMKKRIGIDELKPGMLVEQLDRSWLDTPFFRHKMTITSTDQIAQLRACGIRTLVVNIEEKHTITEAVKTAPDITSDPIFTASDDTLSVPSAIGLEEELPSARQTYHAAKTIVQNAMHDTRLGRAINMDEVNRVVSDMSDSILRNPDALTSLTRLKKFDEYTFYHSVNTSILAMSLGRHLEFDRTTLHQIGVGGLLHDIGKTKIPPEILNKPGRFKPDEMEIMKQHVLRGVEILSTTTGLGDCYLRPALEHHERVDGTGYPYRRVRSELSQVGMMAAVVDIYDAMTSDRCYHKGQAAHEALQFLYRLSLEGHLDAALVQQFIHVVGLYPVGSVVELNTGETGIVKEVHHHAPLAPVVLLVKSAANTLLSHPKELDLVAQLEKPHRSIATVLDAKQVGIDPTDYLDQKAA
ncbi:MAG: HD-GYP domain-containing protein [Nitrospira sp.]|nr:HD-GYP domain-containing protein [Nitrospira sp.]